MIINKDKKTIENDIKLFLVYLREKRKVKYVSASQYLNAVKKFYYVNLDYELKWSLIKMYLGNDDRDDDDNDNNNNSTIEKKEVEEEQEQEQDRPYTRTEIQTMLKTANDPRVKIVILLMSSSGIRLGGIPQLKLRNLTKIDKYNIYIKSMFMKSLANLIIKHFVLLNVLQ